MSFFAAVRYCHCRASHVVDHVAGKDVGCEWYKPTYQPMLTRGSVTLWPRWPYSGSAVVAVDVLTGSLPVAHSTRCGTGRRHRVDTAQWSDSSQGGMHEGVPDLNESESEFVRVRASE